MQGKDIFSIITNWLHWMKHTFIVVKLATFLTPPYIWQGPSTMCDTVLLVIGTQNNEKNHNSRDCTGIAYCRCRNVVKLFRFLTSPFSLIGSCSSAQNCAFRDCIGIFDSLQQVQRRAKDIQRPAVTVIEDLQQCTKLHFAPTGLGDRVIFYDITIMKSENTFCSVF